VRLDFFGDTLESIRSFNPETQRTSKQLKRLDLVPMSEVVLSEESISRFRRSYLASFGAASRDDVLYQSISDGRRYAGMEHWLPLFHERLETLFDFIGDVPVVLDASSADAVRERLDQVAEHYKAREERREMGSGAGTVPYMPVPPESLYFTQDEWTAALADRATATLDPFTPPPGSGKTVIELGGRQGRSFAAERTAGDVNIFDALTTHVRELQKSGKRTVIACWSDGSRDRLGQILGDHGLGAVQECRDAGRNGKASSQNFGTVCSGHRTRISNSPISPLSASRTFWATGWCANRRRKSKGANVITEATGLSEGDLVVHVEHGIGRFIGLKTVEAIGAPHDCLELQYAGGDKLYLPVENIELLSRYGSEDQEAQLDKLGGGAWQARKAKLKKRILEIADGLIKTAAARALKTAPVVETPEGVYDEFATRFPYEETDDQLNAIDSVFEDLALRPADGPAGVRRCRLRQDGSGAARRIPCRHVRPSGRRRRADDAAGPPALQDLSERFHGLPINVAHASRLVPTAS
jgi:transcription-repair coupling factor (superfamily II helicase)